MAGGKGRVGKKRGGEEFGREERAEKTEKKGASDMHLQPQTSEVGQLRASANHSDRVTLVCC